MTTADDALDRLGLRINTFKPEQRGTYLTVRYDDLQHALDELQRLREERDAQDERWQEFSRPFDKAEFDAMYEARMAAEAEVRRLTEGLRDVETCAGYPVMVREKARALLAGSPSETVSATPRTDSPDGAKPEGGEA